MKPLIVRNYGGARHLSLGDADALARIEAIDPARWAATSAPLRDLHCDPALARVLDPDSTGRLRTAGLIAARDWLFARLARRQRLAERSEILVLDDLDTSTEAGGKLRAAAEHVLAQLERPSRDKLSLSDVREFRASYSKRLANGDGVICAAQLPEPAVAKLVESIVTMVGGALDGSGGQGAGHKELERFLDRGNAWRNWKKREHDPALEPLGEQTQAAAELVGALRPKLEEFFFQCDLLRLEGRSPEQLRASPEEVRSRAAAGREGLAGYLAAAPLATPVAEGALRLDGPLNPLWRERLLELQTRVLGRLPAAGGEPVLTRERWKQIEALLAPYEGWLHEKPAEPFDKLDPALLDGYLGGELPSKLERFIETDKAASGEIEQLGELEKLLLLQRWLLEVANNFVSFSALYAPGGKALVDAGSLVIDGRRLDLCLEVPDRAEHKKVALESQLFLVYAAISEKEGAPTAFEVVAPVTTGERGRLRIGKRGLFIDTAGRQWDARVVDMVENPISLVEAIRSPFRRASAFVSKKIEELSSRQLESREKLVQGHLDNGAKKAEGAAERIGAEKPAAPAPAPAAAAKRPEGGGMSPRDLLLGGGIAFAALGSAMAYVVSALSKVDPVKALLAVAMLVVVIGAFAALTGWLKLRKRDLAPLLEANGWAINAQLKLTRRLGRLFTREPELPEGTIADTADALDLRKRRGRFWLLALALLLLAGAIGWGLYSAPWRPSSRSASDEAAPAPAASEAPSRPAATEKPSPSTANPTPESP